MLATLKAWCRHSLTIGWTYMLAAAGVAMEALPPLLDLLGVPEVGDAIKSALGPWAGVYTIVIAVMTYAARMRSLRKAS